MNPASTIISFNPENVEYATFSALDLFGSSFISLQPPLAPAYPVSPKVNGFLLMLLATVCLAAFAAADMPPRVAAADTPNSAAGSASSAAAPPTPPRPISPAAAALSPRVLATSTPSFFAPLTKSFCSVKPLSASLASTPILSKYAWFILLAY